MRKILLVSAILCMLCSCNFGNAKKNAASANVHAGHEWVDLGLSVKWATCNVGALSQEDYGDHFAWGETKSKSDYTLFTSAFSGIDMGDIGGSQYDAARANWGGSWRIPTDSELHELRDYCMWTPKIQNGKKGFKVISMINGQSIFLPAAGYRIGEDLLFDGEEGAYWSSTPVGYINTLSYGLYWEEGFLGMDSGYRRVGCSIRPVLED